MYYNTCYSTLSLRAKWSFRHPSPDSHLRSLAGLPNPTFLLSRYSSTTTTLSRTCPDPISSSSSSSSCCCCCCYRCCCCAGGGGNFDVSGRSLVLRQAEEKALRLIVFSGGYGRIGGRAFDADEECLSSSGCFGGSEGRLRRRGGGEMAEVSRSESSSSSSSVLRDFEAVGGRRRRRKIGKVDGTLRRRDSEDLSSLSSFLNDYGGIGGRRVTEEDESRRNENRRLIKENFRERTRARLSSSDSKGKEYGSALVPKDSSQGFGSRIRKNSVSSGDPGRKQGPFQRVSEDDKFQKEKERTSLVSSKLGTSSRLTDDSLSRRTENNVTSLSNSASVLRKKREEQDLEEISRLREEVQKLKRLYEVREESFEKKLERMETVVRRSSNSSKHSEKLVELGNVEIEKNDSSLSNPASALPAIQEDQNQEEIARLKEQIRKLRGILEITHIREEFSKKSKSSNNKDTSDVKVQNNDETSNLALNLLEEVKRQRGEIDMLTRNYHSLILERSKQDQAVGSLRTSASDMASSSRAEENISASVLSLVEELKKQRVEIDRLIRSQQELITSSEVQISDTERMRGSNKVSISRLRERNNSSTTSINLIEEDLQKHNHTEQLRKENHLITQSSEQIGSDIQQISRKDDTSASSSENGRENSTPPVNLDVRVSEKSHRDEQFRNDYTGVTESSKIQQVNMEKASNSDKVMTSSTKAKEKSSTTNFNLSSGFQSENRSHGGSLVIRESDAERRTSSMKASISSSREKDKASSSAFDSVQQMVEKQDYAGEFRKYKENASAVLQKTDTKTTPTLATTSVSQSDVKKGSMSAMKLEVERVQEDYGRQTTENTQNLFEFSDVKESNVDYSKASVVGREDQSRSSFSEEIKQKENFDLFQKSKSLPLISEQEGVGGISVASSRSAHVDNQLQPAGSSQDYFEFSEVKGSYVNYHKASLVVVGQENQSPSSFPEETKQEENFDLFQKIKSSPVISEQEIIGGTPVASFSSDHIDNQLQPPPQVGDVRHDALDSARRLQKSSSQYVGEFVDKARREIFASDESLVDQEDQPPLSFVKEEKDRENFRLFQKSKSSPLISVQEGHSRASVCSSNIGHVDNQLQHAEQTSDVKQDALGSARRLQKSSSQYSKEFVDKVRQETFASDESDATSHFSTAGTDSLSQEENVVYSADKPKPVAQLEGSRHPETVSEKKGSLDEMWNVAETSIQEPSSNEEPGRKFSEVAVKTTVAPSDSETAIAKRSGKSMWSLLADVIRMGWTRAGSEKSPQKYAAQSSSDDVVPGDAWYSSHEHDDSEEKHAKKKTRQKTKTSSTKPPIDKCLSESHVSGEEAIVPSERKRVMRSRTQVEGSLLSGVTGRGSAQFYSIGVIGSEAFSGNRKEEPSTSSAIVSTTILPPVTAGTHRSPSTGLKINKIDNSGMHEMAPTKNEDKSESVETEAKDVDLHRRKLQRNKQVPKEHFDDWEEAYKLEAEQKKADELFMNEALLEARKAGDAWEVPIGALLVQDGNIIARGGNLVEELRDSTAHAEMICIKEASNHLQTWRLSGTTLYVTLEPCAMCAGAILQARIDTVVWGAPNKLLGADGSWVRLFPGDGEGGSSLDVADQPAGPVHPFHPKIKIRRGILATECAEVMQQFFQLRRRKDKKQDQSNTPRSSLTNYPNKLLTKMQNMFYFMFCL